MTIRLSIMITDFYKINGLHMRARSYVLGKFYYVFVSFYERRAFLYQLQNFTRFIIFVAFSILVYSSTSFKNRNTQFNMDENTEICVGIHKIRVRDCITKICSLFLNEMMDLIF